MKFALRGTLAFALMFVVAMSARAQDKKQDPLTQPLAYLKDIKFDKAQEEKLAAVKTEFTPKYVALNKRNDEIMTPERKKIANAARKEATDAGKKGKDVTAAIDAALKLNAEDQAKMNEIRKERNQLNKELKARIETFLTEDQKKALTKPKDGK